MSSTVAKRGRAGTRARARAAALLPAVLGAWALAGCVGTTTAGPAPAVPARAEMIGKIERCVAARAGAGLFSGVVRIDWGGKPIFEVAHGVADPATGRPIRMDTKFNLASSPKMFAGVAIGQLVEAGKLRFDDPIGKHLANLPPDIAKITIDQLLTHRSGLGNFLSQANLDLVNNAKTATELLPAAIADGLAFAPGSQWNYSNSGYAVLGAVIEAVSGMSYFDYLRTRIWQPSKMTGIVTDEPADQAVPMTRPRGQGVAPDAPRVPAERFITRGSPAGGLYGDAASMMKFVHALQGGKLVSKPMLAMLLEPRTPTEPQRPFPYGGYGIWSDPATNEVGHAGGTAGVNPNIRWSTKNGWASVALSNFDPFSANTLNKAIGAILDGRAMEDGVCNPPSRPGR